MARKKKETESKYPGILPGTVEYEAREHWEREKDAYEAATGEKVEYVPPVPVTSTPLAVESEESSESSASEESEVSEVPDVAEVAEVEESEE